MKIQLSKKTMLVVLGVFVVLFAIVMILFIKGNFGKKYPKEPLELTNLSTTKQTLDISNVELNTDEKDVPVYTVDRKVHTEAVANMISDMGLSLKRTDEVKDSYITWSDEDNSFEYDSLSDSVSFNISEKLSIERGSDAFKEFFSKYLGLNYDFVINSQKNTSQGITYYASRLLDGIPIENSYGYEYTDILVFDNNGSLVSGKIFLAEITKYDLDLPLLNDSDLKNYINLESYPKERYLDTSVLESTLNLNYLSDAWGSIEDSAKDCKGTSSKLIFLFSNTDQGYLFPVYKMDATCTVTYLDNTYSVPAVFYVNAADTDYVVTK